MTSSRVAGAGLLILAVALGGCWRSAGSPTEEGGCASSVDCEAGQTCSPAGFCECDHDSCLCCGADGLCHDAEGDTFCTGWEGYCTVCPAGTQCLDGECATTCPPGSCDPEADVPECMLDTSDPSYHACEDHDGDGCGTWGEPIQCPPGFPCEGGTCVDQCSGRCAEGEYQCIPGLRQAAVEQCVMVGGCPDWRGQTPCDQATDACLDLVCAPDCDPECEVGETRCAPGEGPDKFKRCEFTDEWSCNAFGAALSCEELQFCDPGTDSCQDCAPCDDACVPEEPYYRTCDAVDEYGCPAPGSEIECTGLHTDLEHCYLDLGCIEPCPEFDACEDLGATRCAEDEGVFDVMEECRYYYEGRCVGWISDPCDEDYVCREATGVAACDECIEPCTPSSTGDPPDCNVSGFNVGYYSCRDEDDLGVTDGCFANVLIDCVFDIDIVDQAICLACATENDLVACNEDGCTTPGSRMCFEGSSFRTCQLTDGGCLAWSETPTHCDPGEECDASEVFPCPGTRSGP